MSKSKRAEARDEVILAARRWRYTFSTGTAEALMDAIDALDAIEPGSFDGTGAWVAGSPETSQRAAEMYVPAMKSVRRQIINEIACRHDGLATDEMLERALHCKHQTLSSARNFLVIAGWLEDSLMRTTDKRAVLWQLTDAGRKMLREAR